jgi:Alpha amylase, catalytic domain/Major Facilitator Superfamily
MIDDLWYKNGVIYCLSVGTYMDANGDGVGDFKGLLRRLDYLHGLGITAIWLMPFQPSPGKDDGYDISDYYGVDLRYGTLGDFVEFTHGCKQRGIRVIIDLVVNHTSNEHSWFRAARSAKDSPYRDWYVWADKRPSSAGKGMVFPGVQKSTWTHDKEAGAWYFHRFYDFQPDLNTSNPRVQAEILKIMGFWIQLGVSGFRMDAVPFVIASKGPKMKKPLEHYDMLMIVGFAVAAAFCLTALVIWELITEDPIIDIRLLGQRQFGACFIAMLGTGAIVIATTQILPQLLQAELNYTATLAGLVLSPGGLVTMVMMPVTGRLIGSVQPKYLIAAGAAIAALSMWHLTGITGDITYGYAAMSRIYLAIGLPLLFLPITTASYDGVPPDKTNQASALINVARNLGGSMGVALSQTVLAQRQQFHQNRLIEHIAPSDLGYQQSIEAMTRFFQAQGSNTSDAAGQAVAWVGQTLQHQIDLLAYIDVFWKLAVIGAIMVPVALSLRSIDLSSPTRGH